LFETADDEEHAFDGLRGQLVELLRARHGHVVRLILRDQVVVLGHLRCLKEIPIYIIKNMAENEDTVYRV
jgi:hypothetical protein